MFGLGPRYDRALSHAEILRCAAIFLEVEMTKSRSKKASATLVSPDPDACFTVEQTPDELRKVLWRIALDPKESGTAKVGACRLLLMDARERGDGGETRLETDLNRRALALLNRVAN